MIAGIGTDIVEIQRVNASLQRFGSAFRNRVFTPAEQEEARRRNEAPSFYAGRWAANSAPSPKSKCSPATTARRNSPSPGTPRKPPPGSG